MADAEDMGFNLASVYEYDLRGLGPWKSDAEGINIPPHTAFYTHDPAAQGGWAALWWDSVDQIYIDGGGRPIYFAGTDPRRRGFPPPADEKAVGNPEAQWMDGLSAEEYLDYIGMEWGS